MPAWQGALEDKDIWAIAHYVHSLMAMRDTKEATLMREKFAAQAPFEVPKPEEPKPEPAAEPAKDEKADAKDEKKADAKDAKKADAKDAKKAPEKGK